MADLVAPLAFFALLAVGGVGVVILGPYPCRCRRCRQIREESR
jgi:hypothetical protein